MIQRYAMLVLLCLAAASVAGQQDSPYVTGDLLNGRFWRMMSKPEKVAFVMGFEQASVMVAVDFTSDLPLEKGLARTREYYPIGATRQETVEYLDGFFSDALNGRLPIGKAIAVFCMGSNGKSASDIDAATRLMRKVYQ